MNHLTHNLILVSIVCLAPSLGCDDDRVIQAPYGKGTPTKDGTPDQPPPVEPEEGTFCRPNSTTCLGANSPLYEQCREDGLVTEIKNCGDGQMCRDGQCVTFSCFPQRPLCVGADSIAICADTGRAVQEIQDCPDGTTCRQGACVDLCQEAAQQQSYIGCDYIAQELYNIYRAPGDTTSQSPYGIVVANTLPQTQVLLNAKDVLGEYRELIARVEITTDRGRGVDTQEVFSAILKDGVVVRKLSGVVEDIALPPNHAAVLLMETERGRSDSIFLNASHPVVAYQFSPYCCNITSTNDASLLLPTSALQNTYRVVGYPTWASTALSARIQPYVYITATQNNTQVRVTHSEPIANNQFPDIPSTLDPIDASQGHTITLNRGDAHILSATGDTGDLSGMLIEANAPVSVWSGHPCTFVPTDKWACDHLEEQMLPASTLGTNYVLQAVKQRSASLRSEERTYWRIVAHEDAVVEFDPPLTELDVAPPSNTSTIGCERAFVDGVLNMRAGNVCEIGLSTSISVQSTGALAVAGVISGQNSTGQTIGARAGDPSMFVVPPVEQFREDYTFVAPPTFIENYAAVTVPQGIQVALDDVQIPTQNKLQSQTVESDGTTWITYHVSIKAGVHTLKASEPFGLVVYAYDDYVSYAFPGGLDLKPTIKQ